MLPEIVQLTAWGWIEQEEGGQVILTAPKPTDVEVRGGALPRWSLRHGVVEAL